ncbi:MAG: bactofilin family protein [Allosphingosinicella sp.]
MRQDEPARGHPGLAEPGQELSSEAAGHDDTLPDAAVASCIGPRVRVTGDIEGGDIQIDGHVVGDIRCTTLALGSQAVVTGTIHARRVRVSGAFDGAIRTEDLAVEATARLKGELTYVRVRIASGAVIDGQLRFESDRGTPHADEPTLRARPL